MFLNSVSLCSTSFLSAWADLAMLQNKQKSKRPLELNIFDPASNKNWVVLGIRLDKTFFSFEEFNQIVSLSLCAMLILSAGPSVPRFNINVSNIVILYLASSL